MVMIPILPPFWYFLENINLHATQELHIRLELGLAHSHHSSDHLQPLIGTSSGNLSP